MHATRPSLQLEEVCCVCVCVCLCVCVCVFVCVRACSRARYTNIALSLFVVVVGDVEHVCVR